MIFLKMKGKKETTSRKSIYLVKEKKMNLFIYLICALWCMIMAAL